MDNSNTILPLFIKQAEVTKSDENIAAIDIVTAACKIVGNGNVVGVQRVNSLWLIYLKDRTSRLQLYTKENIIVKGNLIHMYDENPFTTRNQQQRNENLTIKNLPLTVNN